jgi:hypothetical protein
MPWSSWAPTTARADRPDRPDPQHPPMPEQPGSLPSLPRERRDRTVSMLTRHFSLDHIGTEEFERRIDRVYEARTVQELDALVADLPALDEAATVQTLAAGESPRGWQMVLALMGGTERKGTWRPARQISAVALMGGISLDFREAQFAPGVTSLNVMALMGGVEIVVPPGLRVECDGFGFMGGFENLDQEGRPGEDQPTLRIRGLALMGGVEVTERRPGETSRQKKERLRDERRRRKELGQG